MKKIRFVAMASVLAAFAASEVQAQIELEITPFAGGTVFLADPPSQFALGRTTGNPLIVEDGAFDNAWTLGMNAGIRVNETWALEGMFSWIPTKLSATNGLVSAEDVNGYMYGITALYYIPLRAPVSFFVGAGAGGETFDYATAGLKSETEFMGNVVGGLFVSLTDAIGMRLEARDCFARFNSGVTSVKDTWENDLMMTVGLSFRAPIRN